MVRRLTVPVPQAVADLSADWLTDALHQSGAIHSARVTSFTTGTPGSGRGFTGQTFRVVLEWDRPEEGAPATVLLKVPSADPGNRGLVEKGRRLRPRA